MVEKNWNRCCIFILPDYDFSYVSKSDDKEHKRLL